MPNKLLIVESPTKAKTISRFLGDGFTILSSYGHVRDLPKSAMGIEIDKDFDPQYVVPADSKKNVAALKKAAGKADAVFFATDEDREGEAISWHIAHLLKLDPAKIKRITFHEITQSAIKAALESPRVLNENLVNAQQARRLLDRLVGYELSPLIWKKIAYGLSAGRVQSVAVNLIVQRELERIAFHEARYWDLLAKLEKDGTAFEARLTSVGGKRVAIGKDFDAATGQLTNRVDAIVLDGAAASNAAKRLDGKPWTVASATEKPVTARPAAPFITSTLQQEANRKLGLSSRQTMRSAQRLYEEGYITYMRTDSPTLSQEGIAGARSVVESSFGKDYLSPEPRQFTAKSKGAQEAHEAIRPAGSPFKDPASLPISGAEKKLYELIWKRTVATQMADAKKLSVSVSIDVEDMQFSATGTTILFPGFLKVYQESRDDSNGNGNGNGETVLPKLAKGDTLTAQSVDPQEHATKPPARFTDATIVKILEANGVGRPSTYASIIGTILDRGYVRRDKNTLIPTFTGFAVDQLLRKYFAHLVDTSFTASMEETLDAIAEGTQEWKPYLKNFYSGDERFHQQVVENEERIDPKDSRRIDHPALPEGTELRVGRFGPYLVRGSDTDEEAVRVSIPEDVAPADLTTEKIDELIALQKDGPKSIGTHPETGEPIYCLTGRYGPYVQLGEKTDEQPKPRRASIPKGQSPSDVTLEDAVKYLSLPRVLGTHPETRKEIMVNVGRFGPYVACDGEFRSLKKDDDVYTVKLDRALELLAEEKRSRRAAKTLKELGPHPKDKKPVTLHDGKYGPCVKHGRTNASLPRDMEPDSITIDTAVELLAKRRSKKSS